MRATLHFLEKLTLEPWAVDSVDVDRLLTLGVSLDQVVDAVHVAAVYNVINRCSDALSFEFPPDFDPVRHGSAVLQSGYARIVGDEPAARPTGSRMSV